LAPHGSRREYFEQLEAVARSRQKAADLRQRFEQLFWCERLGFYAYALDRDKEQVHTIASNPGHLLWSGIMSPERATRVVARILQLDMWSGWGIRTLSSENPAYNPFSYQNGSVWPHHSGIIDMEFKRYGFAQEAAMIARDISEAASYFGFYRLPELYAGARREPWVSPSSIWEPMCISPEPRAAACFTFCRRFLDWMPTRTRKLFIEIRFYPTGFPTSPCITCALEQAP
jgi:glycogen debranching enzyme